MTRLTMSGVKASFWAVFVAISLLGIATEVLSDDSNEDTMLPLVGMPWTGRRVPKALASIYQSRSSGSWNCGRRWVDKAKEIKTQPFQGCHGENNFQFNVDIEQAVKKSVYLLRAELGIPSQELSCNVTRQIRTGIHCRGVSKVFFESSGVQKGHNSSVTVDVSSSIRQIFRLIATNQHHNRPISTTHCRIRLDVVTEQTDDWEPISCRHPGLDGGFESPNLMLYYTQPMSPLAKAISSTQPNEPSPEEEQGKRSKRSANPSLQRFGPGHLTSELHRPCRLIPYGVNSSILDTRSERLLQPRVLKLNMCVGQCNLAGVVRSQTAHSLIQSELNRYGLESGLPDGAVMPSACCVPVELASLTILALHSSGGVRVTTYNATLITACGCR